MHPNWRRPYRKQPLIARIAAWLVILLWVAAIGRGIVVSVYQEQRCSSPSAYCESD
jgi:hypothetical protein